MCLTYNERLTLQMKAEKVEKITAYKVVSISEFSGIFSFYHSWKSWIVGYNASDRCSQSFNHCDDYISSQCIEINCGIHVYLNLQDAIQEAIRWGSNVRVIEVECAIKDLVAVSEKRQAVFMGVTLTQKEHDIATGRYVGS